MSFLKRYRLLHDAQSVIIVVDVVNNIIIIIINNKVFIPS